MSEYPVLFSAPMVRAILDLSKRHTRRIVKPQPIVSASEAAVLSEAWDAGFIDVKCPYGVPGDRLWVKETFFAWGRWETRFSAKKGRDEWHFIDMTVECDKRYRYAADIGRKPSRDRGGVTPTWWMRPSIFMPRHASRITLEISGTRVERLNDISEADVIAEGCPREILYGAGWYRDLWESLNGAGSWNANPWVWVIEFKRLEKLQ